VTWRARTSAPKAPAALATGCAIAVPCPVAEW
jgi:hypothetical protein